MPFGSFKIVDILKVLPIFLIGYVISSIFINCMNYEHFLWQEQDREHPGTRSRHRRRAGAGVRRRLGQVHAHRCQ